MQLLRSGTGECDHHEGLAELETDDRKKTAFEKALLISHRKAWNVFFYRRKRIQAESERKAYSRGMNQTVIE